MTIMLKTRCGCFSFLDIWYNYGTMPNRIVIALLGKEYSPPNDPGDWEAEWEFREFLFTGTDPDMGLPMFYETSGKEKT